MAEPWVAIHLDDEWSEVYCDGFKLGPFQIAVAERVVHAVNCHDELVAALKSALKSASALYGFDPDKHFLSVQAALAKAKATENPDG